MRSSVSGSNESRCSRRPRRRRCTAAGVAVPRRLAGGPRLHGLPQARRQADRAAPGLLHRGPRLGRGPDPPHPRRPAISDLLSPSPPDRADLRAWPSFPETIDRLPASNGQDGVGPPVDALPMRAFAHAPTEPRRVLILGGGFGGIYAALELEKVLARHGR